MALASVGSAARLGLTMFAYGTVHHCGKAVKAIAEVARKHPFAQAVVLENASMRAVSRSFAGRICGGKVFRGKNHANPNISGL